TVKMRALSHHAGTGLSSTRRYRFDDVEIDLDAREIVRSGERADVEAKVFDLIELLLLARGRALSKGELTSALWADRPVTDAALSQQLRKARRALGDDGDAQRVIRTVHGRGLRWVAEVSEIAGDDVAVAESPMPPEPVAIAAVEIARAETIALPARSRRRSWLGAAVIALVLAVAAGLVLRYPIRAAGDPTLRTRIAVLPIGDRTGEPDLAWTANGLMGLMTSLFEQAGGVEVVPAGNVQAIAGKDGAVDSAVARRALGATHFVAAQLRRVGPLYELELHLFASGAAERSETLHGSAPAPLAVDAVARVRRWLDLTALPDTRGSGIESAFLAEAYARGLDAALHGDHAGAKKYFEICLDHDPGLAWPRLGLAIAESAIGDAGASDANVEKVIAAARERNDRDLLVPALRQRATLAYRRGDLDAARRDLDEALGDVSAEDQALATSELLVGVASIEDERGEFAASRAHFDQALALARRIGDRRGEANVLANIASLDNGAGDAAAAAASLRAALDAARAAGDASLEGSILGNLGATQANEGRLLDAIALLKQGLSIAIARGDTRLEALIAIQLVWALAPFAHDADARALANRVLALGNRESNSIWQAEAHWALAALDVRSHAWRDAFAQFEQARTIYAASGIARNLAPLLAEVASAAAEARDPAKAREAAEALRALASEQPEFRRWLPLADADLLASRGDVRGSADALVRLLDARPPAQIAQSALFDLGHRALALGDAATLLARPEWKPWLDQHPDAIALHAAALRLAGDAVAADAEQQRLDALRSAPELYLDPAWLAVD
ncbi:MAG: winged helix-turn-helix domain-containing protein, partial [Rhodanobacteraceae bacterium]